MIKKSIHPLLSAPKACALAHRGGALEGEENTLPAFAQAQALGFTHAELDVHTTRDNVVVIHHDADLARLCSDPRRIAELDHAELKSVRTHGGAEIPTLEAFLHEFPKMFAVIEVKTRRAIDPLCDLILRLGAMERICISGFDEASTQDAIGRLGPDLLWSPAHGQVARLWARGWGLRVPLTAFRVVQVPVRWRGVAVVTPRFVRAAHAAGVCVQVWTVNDSAEMIRLLDMGVDGLITDRPSLLREVLLARGVWPSDAQ